MLEILVCIVCMCFVVFGTGFQAILPLGVIGNSKIQLLGRFWKMLKQYHYSYSAGARMNSDRATEHWQRPILNRQKLVLTALLCPKRLVFVLGLYKDISNSFEPPLNILQSPQIVVILFPFNLFIIYSFVSLRAQIVVISFESL